MLGRITFMFIGCVLFTAILVSIEKILGVEHSNIPCFVFGLIWGFISDDVLVKLQEKGFFKFLK